MADDYANMVEDVIVAFVVQASESANTVKESTFAWNAKGKGYVNMAKDILGVLRVKKLAIANTEKEDIIAKNAKKKENARIV